MKKQLKLSVNIPCQEKFNRFSPTEKGAFCLSCSTEVIDFTVMTDQEIVDYFNTPKGKVCGRFHESQLKSYAVHQRTKLTNYAALGIVGLSLASLLASAPAQAQEKEPSTVEIQQSNLKKSQKRLNVTTTKSAVVKGTIFDKSGALPGVSIWLKGTTLGTDTDIEGSFTFPKPLKVGDVLVFSYLGYATIEIPIATHTMVPLQIKMKEDDSMIEFVVMGEVQVEELFKSKKSKLKKSKKKI